jgi:hypothetical protein
MVTTEHLTQIGALPAMNLKQALAIVALTDNVDLDADLDTAAEVVAAFQVKAARLWAQKIIANANHVRQRQRQRQRNERLAGICARARTSGRGCAWTVRIGDWVRSCSPVLA